MRTLVAWAATEVMSLAGTRFSMIAIPWLVLTTSGSATQTGLVALFELAPYVLTKALGGPLIDRLGPRRVAIVADAAATVLAVAIPLLHLAGISSLWLLLVLIALLGAVRGPGDSAKHVLAPPVAAVAGVPLERATGISSTSERLATTVGAALAGAIIAVVGPAPAIFVTAGCFAAAALIMATAVRIPHVHPESEPNYLGQLAVGWSFLRRDPVLVAVVAMIAVTNLLDVPFTAVLIPVWALEHGAGSQAVGLILACCTGGALAGAVIATFTADRLPRYLIFVGSFVLGGAPRYLVLGLSDELWVVIAVMLVSGFCSGFVNPILGAVIFERTPRAVIGRVNSLITASAWSLMPFGGLLGGVVTDSWGLAVGATVIGLAFLLATMTPVFVPAFRQLNHGQGAARMTSVSP